MTSRRLFLSSLVATAVAAKANLLDLDRLLWVPGKKLISIPAPPPESIFSVPIDRSCLLIGGVLGYQTPWIKHNLILTTAQSLILEPGMLLQVDLTKNELKAYYSEATK